jgi:hypothetical protein
MTSSSFWPVSHGKTSHGKTAERGVFLAPALYVSIAIAIFVVVTQLLATTGAVSLSTTQLLAMWLAAAALIVLLWIAYMICRAYVTGAAPLAGPQGRSEQEAQAAREQIARARWDAEQQKARAEEQKARAEDAAADVEQARAEVRKAEKRVEEALKDPEEPPKDGSPRNNGSAGEDEEAWVPPGELRHLDGTGRPVSTAEVFPDGCYLQPDSIRLDVEDTLTGRQVYQCRVVDLNSANDRTHQTVVNILADRPPVPPTGQPFERVEFDNLTMIAYVTDRSPMRIRYSLRATGIHAAGAPARRVKATWTAPSNGQAAGRDQMPGRPAVSR